MGRRRASKAHEGPAIPPELYYGLAPGAFVASTDQAVMARSLGAHREWSDAAREAGWTAFDLREAAAHDQGYINWRRRQQRERLIKQDTELRRQG